MIATELELIKPDDMHIHLRQGEQLKNYVADAGVYFQRAVVMPNTVPPIDSPETLKKYKHEIEDSFSGFKALMTFKLHPRITPDGVKDLKEAGCIGGKLYPEGVTTNTGEGITNIQDIYPLFEALEDLDMVLNIHAEEPGAFSLDREREYLPRIQKIIENFPRLRIIVEHISDMASVEFVNNASENIAASITVHHMELTLDQIIGARLQPHHFCKPVPKRPRDKKAILDAALSGSSKYFLGTDSAPHLKKDKESDRGCAGIYSAPVAMPVLLETFESAGALAKVENFTSVFGSDFYKIPRNTSTLRMRKKPWKVPDEIHGVVPYKAGETLSWGLF